MIVRDSLIRVASGEPYILVQDLRIGQSIYDPMTGINDEIVDIFSRSIDLRTQNARYLIPIKIPQYGMGNGYPIFDVSVSPAQVLLVAIRNDASEKYRSVQEILASAAPFGITEISPHVTYFAIIFKRKRHMDVAGLLTKAYVLEDICGVDVA